MFVWTAAPADPTAATATETPASTSGEYGVTLEDIIVTAQRRAETVQTVPISIDALGKDDLAVGNIKTIEDIGALVPGLQFAVPNGFSSAFTTIAIRGLNTNTGPPTVGLYMDDTTISSRLSGTANQGNVYPIVWDLNRVEVERGPQGTLFGAGSEAGTVRFITNQPSLTDFSGLARGELSQTEGGKMSYEAALALGGPIVNDEIGYRISIYDRQDGGWVNREDPVTGEIVARNANTMDHLAAKAALAFKVGDALITAGLYHQDVHQDDARRFYAAYSDAQAGVFVNGVLLPEVWTDKWTLPSIKLEDHLPFADLTVDTSYFDRTATEILDESAFVCPGMVTNGQPGCGNPLGTGYPSQEDQVAYTPTNLYVKAYTAEARLASTNSPDSRLSWVAGFYFEHRTQRDFQTDYDQADYPQAFPSNPVPACTQLQCYVIQDQHELFVDAQRAIYAQADIRLFDPLTLTLGERLAHVTVQGALTTGISYLTGAPPWAGFSGSNNPSTPRGGLTYHLDQHNLLYFTFSEGYRPGGGNSSLPTTGPCGLQVANPVPRVQAVYSPDTVHAFEVGAKDTLFDGRLQVNTSIFYNQWNNIQQYVSESCGPYAFGTNGGNAVSDGFDLAARALLMQGLRLDVNVGYVNAYYTKSGYIPNLPPSQASILVVEGDKVGILPQVNPPWNVNTMLNYSFPLSNGDKVHL
ncbi:MAG TPA: TonB-dependent receptor, partial [Steroidobacteraceae bacterium]|nr:TonB-dependent receptor [Steroidobacteraceae bacterium]